MMCILVYAWMTKVRIFVRDSVRVCTYSMYVRMYVYVRTLCT